MTRNTLALILAAGKGTRVSSILDETQPAKALLKVGDNRDKPIIELAIDSIGDLDAQKAVMTYHAPEFDMVDRIAVKRGVKVLKQKAIRIKLPHLLELPYLLTAQYHYSRDASYLQSFDSILVMPCDIVLQGVDLDKMVKFHYDSLGHPDDRQITMLSKPTIGEGRTELFRMEGSRVVGWKGYCWTILEGYVPSTQSGVYVLSKSVLQKPFRLILGLGHNRLIRYSTNGNWKDYGRAEAFSKKI